jgi:hypothetical protein
MRPAYEFPQHAREDQNGGRRDAPRPKGQRLRLGNARKVRPRAWPEPGEATSRKLLSRLTDRYIWQVSHGA